tara:strand:+ start:11973 stop:12935 length:963 start_codon:yes stop_codon:yes gene_type:complete
MKKTSKKILITGGAGYVGQNLVRYFLDKNYKVAVIDNLSTSKKMKKDILNLINFYNIDLTRDKKVKSFFKNKKFDLIIHLAAFSGVKEFNKNVKKSFNNNVLSARNIINYAFKDKNTKLIFSSSAAVYGKVSREKISEKNICNPANYYGLSKLACEHMINDTFNKKANSYAILRYFNVVGSIIDFKLEKKINSLFDVISKNIRKKIFKININGGKFNTKDGTPERDFIHINNLCKIHEKIYYYLNKKKNITVNCGSGKRYSVLEVVKAFEKKIKRKFRTSFNITNPDETSTICANTYLLKKITKIDLKKNNLNDLIKKYV